MRIAHPWGGAALQVLNAICIENLFCISLVEMAEYL